MDKAQSLAVDVRPESTLFIFFVMLLLLLKGPYPKAYMTLGPYWCS